MSHEPSSPEPVESTEDKVLLILSYLGLFSLIPFFIAKNDYVKWHAKQGLTLLLVLVGVQIALVIVGNLIAFIPFLPLLMSSVVGLGILALIIIAIIKALSGMRWRIPLVADLTEKLFK